jgi:hypothetical protein
MEEKIGLGAIWVLLALMVFGELFGFMGVLLAVPAAAVTKIFVQRAVARYRESDLYTSGGPAPADATHSLIAGILSTDVTPDEVSFDAGRAEPVEPPARAADSPQENRSPPAPDEPERQE